MTNKEIILAFIDRINVHDVEGLAALMSDDHTFIDAHGNQVSGKQQMNRRLARLLRMVSRLLHRDRGRV
jgi:ketosteroid isomerase-like protein